MLDCPIKQTLTDRNCRAVKLHIQKLVKQYIALVPLALFIGTNVLADVPKVEADSARCEASAVEGASDANALRALATACSDNNQIWTLVKQKLISLPYPTPPKLNFTPLNSNSKLESATYELDVFFEPFEAYPPEIAFEKLNQLIHRIGLSSVVESIEIEAGADSIEIETGIGGNIASMRAFRIREYLVSSGVPLSVPVKVVGKVISKEQTVEGRAKARSVSVRVATKRNAR